MTFISTLTKCLTWIRPARITNKTKQLVPGRFIATNNRLSFLPDTDKAGQRIDWNNIAQIKQKDTNSLQVKLLSGTGNRRTWACFPCFAARISGTSTHLPRYSGVNYKSLPPPAWIASCIKRVTSIQNASISSSLNSSGRGAA